MTHEIVRLPEAGVCCRCSVLLWSMTNNPNKQLVSSGTVWEKKYGYSRAVRVGDTIFVAGTTAVDEHGTVVGPNDPYAQAMFIFKKIDSALREAGSSLSDVVRVDRKSTRLNSSHIQKSRMPSSA